MDAAWKMDEEVPQVITGQEFNTITAIFAFSTERLNATRTAIHLSAEHSCMFFLLKQEMSHIWTEQKEENVNKTNLNKSLRGCYTVIQKLIYKLD